MINGALHTFVVFQLGRRHIAQTDVAASAGVTASMVNQVIMGKKRSERVQSVLMDMLGYGSWADLMGAAYRFQAALSALAEKEA